MEQIISTYKKSDHRTFWITLCKYKQIKLI
jgi:hypothetical protein